MAKQKQRLLHSEGTVEDYEKSRRMFMQLFEALCDRPIIGHTMWADSITTEQKARIKIERMKQIKKANGEKITESTEYEALIYVMTASLANPLSRTWFNIYAWLFRKFYPEKAKEIFSEYEGQKLEKWTEESDLIRLKRWLYKVSKK